MSFYTVINKKMTLFEEQKFSTNGTLFGEEGVYINVYA